MRNGTVWLAALFLMAATGLAQGHRNSPPGTLLRWHYAGWEHLQQLQDQKPLQAVLALPETAALREAALQKFAAQAASRFARGEGGGTNAGPIASHIQALLPDLLRFETRFLMTGAETGAADWSLGIRLPEEREAEWRAKLTGLARGAGLKVADEANWSAATDKYHLALERSGKWVLLRGGYSAVPTKTQADFRKGLEQPAGEEVFSADVDLPRLAELWKLPRLGHAPRLTATATPNRDGFRSILEIDYPRELGIKPEKWVVPSGLLSEPLIGFTAIQGLKDWLGDRPNLKALELEKTPNQLFSWSVGDTPFSLYLAAEVGNPKEAIANLVHKAIPNLQQGPSAIVPGQAQVSSNGTSMVWRGLPVVMPFAQVGDEPFSNFLVTGLFPIDRPATNKVPAALFEQLKEKNLVYYDWELTEGRLTQWRPIWQLAFIAASRQLIRGDAPSEKWLAAITPKLGNTITEATLEGPRRIRVVRQSHLGLNALELVLLAHWLDPKDLKEIDGQPGSPASGPRPDRKPAPSNRNAETRR